MTDVWQAPESMPYVSGGPVAPRPRPRELPRPVRHLARAGFATLPIIVGVWLYSVLTQAAKLNLPHAEALAGPGGVLHAAPVLLILLGVLGWTAWMLWSLVAVAVGSIRRLSGASRTTARSTGRFRAVVDPGRWRPRWAVIALAVLAVLGFLTGLVVTAVLCWAFLTANPDSDLEALSVLGPAVLIAAALVFLFFYVLAPLWALASGIAGIMATVSGRGRSSRSKL